MEKIEHIEKINIKDIVCQKNISNDTKSDSTENTNVNNNYEKDSKQKSKRQQIKEIKIKEANEEINDGNPKKRKQPEKPKLKILYLHGFLQSSEIFRTRVDDFNKTFSKQFDILPIYAEAPFFIEEDKETKEKKYGWLKLANVDYENIDFDKVKEVWKQKSVEYLGLKETLCLIQDIASKNPDIDCIFSFSQGSFINVLIGMLIETEIEYKELFKNLKCFVVASGFMNPKPENTEFNINKKVDAFDRNEYKIKLPCLHIFGETDDHVTPDRSVDILKYYEIIKIFKHSGKHFIPKKSADKQFVFEFFRNVYKLVKSDDYYDKNIDFSKILGKQ